MATIEPSFEQASLRRSLWQHRDFLFLWAGQSVSELGSAVSRLAIPLAAVIFINASTLEVGILVAMGTVPYLIFSLPAGVAVDRAAKRRMMLRCDIGRFALIASIPLATLPGLRVTYWQLMVVALLTGILSVFFDVAYQSYLPALLDKKDLIEANGRLATTSSLARITGPAVAGTFVGLLGAARAVSVDAGSYLVSVASLLLIRKEDLTPARHEERREMRRELADGMRFVIGHPIMRKVVACTGISNFFSSMLSAVGLIFLVRVLHASPSYVGIILSLSAVGGLVAGFASKQLSKIMGSARIIWLSQLGFQAPMFLIPMARPGWGALLYAAGLFSFGFGAVVYNIAQVSYRQTITPPEMLGRMNASVRFLVWGAMPLGAALGGGLGSLIGIRATVWLSVAGCWSSGLWLIFSPLRRLRDVDDFVPTAESECPTSIQASNSA